MTANLAADLRDPLTLRKAQALVATHGLRLSGFILTDDQGERALVEHGAVRWLNNAEMWALMHPGTPGTLVESGKEV